MHILVLGILGLAMLSPATTMAEQRGIRTLFRRNLWHRCTAWLVPKPETPTSQYYLAEVLPDPDYPGAFLIHAQQTADPTSSGEFGLMPLFLERFPSLARKLGIRQLTPGHWIYPDVAGLNRRIAEGKRRKDHEIPDIGFTADTSPGLTPIATIAHEWIHNRAMISANGHHEKMSLHFHDVFVHLPAFLLTPRPILQVNQTIMAEVVRLLALPDLEPLERASLQRLQTRMVHQLDGEIYGVGLSILTSHPRKDPPPTDLPTFARIYFGRIAFADASFLTQLEDALQVSDPSRGKAVLPMLVARLREPAKTASLTWRQVDEFVDNFQTQLGIQLP